MARGILDPADQHCRRLVTDAVRAVDAVRALPGVDAARAVVAGNSQGGGLALAVAGLVPDLAAVLTTAPVLCHVQRAVEITDAGPYGEIARYLAVDREAEERVRRTPSYVDGVGTSTCTRSTSTRAGRPCTSGGSYAGSRVAGGRRIRADRISGKTGGRAALMCR